MAAFRPVSAHVKLGLVVVSTLFSGVLLAGAGHNHAQGSQSTAAHVHGAAEMEIVQDGNNLSVILYTPLQNVLGFEYVPKTDTEKVKARRVVSLLRANGLFAFSPEAQCRANGHRLISDILNPHSHGSGDDHQHHDSPDGHSDVRAVYEFECARPDKLKVIDVRLFRQFSGIEKIEVQALFPKGQVGAGLTATKSLLTLPE